MSSISVMSVDLADMTKFIYDSLLTGATKLELYEDTATVRRIPPDAPSVAELAGAIAYVESWAHELTTWATTTQDFSSFSPEDVPSNITGIELGKRAITRGGSFDAAVDAELGTLVNAELGARPAADTTAALTKIKGVWFDTGVLPPLRLLRRNFDGKVWMAGMPYDSPQNFPWLTPTAFVPYFGEFNYSIWRPVAGKSGVTLAAMQTVTDAARTAFTSANPGMDKP